MTAAPIAARAERTRVAVLVGIATVSFIALVMFARRPVFLDRQREYHAAFRDVAGLNVGDEVRYGGVRVGSVSALDIDSAQSVPDRFAICCLEDRDARRSKPSRFVFVLVRAEYLKCSRSRGVKDANVNRVAVTKASRVKPLAVVVDDHRMIDDFIATVTVHVSHDDMMSTLTGVGMVSVFGIENPALAQLASAPVPRG